MSDDRGLQLARAGLRFTDDATEAAFVDWERREAVAPNRAALGAALGAWSFVLLSTCVVPPEPRVPWTIALVVDVVAIAALFASFSRIRPGRGMDLVLALGLALVNSFAVSLASFAYHQPVLSVGIAIIGSYFGFTQFRLPPALPALAVVPVALVQTWALYAELGEAEGGLITTAGGANVLAIAIGSGLSSSLAARARARRSYRQERIIDAQRETIAKQRALLEKELSHQVAERSRELGAVLAKSDVTFDVRALKTGERFAERYKIVSSLGAGGMGAVYEVERVTDSARLALKAVVGEVSSASAARFAREAEIGARVRHPSLVSIVDVGVASGVPFLVMELVRGGSLESQRARFGDVTWALPILRRVAAGLAALHDAGVVHRDLKPANVLLTEGEAKISDFGISGFGVIEDASVDAGADTMAATPKKGAALTATNMVMGTPLYMAPEGAKSARALDSSADVFAFGILAYEMLTGRSPFPVPAFVLAMSGQPLPTPPAIDDPRVTAVLRQLLAAALAVDPPRRPRVRDIAAALGA